MSKMYLCIMFFSFVVGAIAAVAIWGQAESGGDSLIVARVLTAAMVMGVGHCFFKVLFDRQRASY